MKIDNAQLAAFSAVLREGSFEAAARRLNVTPSAISQRIKLLEERLGQVLVQRSAPCLATAAGKMLARHAEQLSLLEAEIFSEMGVSGDLETTSLRVPIIVNADSLDSWFLAVFENMPTDSAINFDIRVEDQDHSAALLREGNVMAAVSASPSSVPGCKVEPLGIMRYLAVASPTYVHRYFANGVDASNLGKAPMLTFNRKDELQARFVALLTDQAKPAPTHFIPSTYGFLEVAKRGLGWGMMPENFVAKALATAELTEIFPEYYLDIPLYWHRWRLNSPVLESLTTLVRNAASKALRPLHS